MMAPPRHRVAPRTCRPLILRLHVSLDPGWGGARPLILGRILDPGWGGSISGLNLVRKPHSCEQHRFWSFDLEIRAWIHLPKFAKT